MPHMQDSQDSGAWTSGRFADVQSTAVWDTVLSGRFGNVLLASLWNQTACDPSRRSSFPEGWCRWACWVRVQALRPVIVCLCHYAKCGHRVSWEKTVRHIKGLSRRTPHGMGVCGGRRGCEKRVSCLIVTLPLTRKSSSSFRSFKQQNVLFLFFFKK